MFAAQDGIKALHVKLYYADMIPGGYGIAALLYAYTAYNRTIRYWTTRSQSVTHETRNTRRAESAHSCSTHRMAEQSTELRGRDFIQHALTLSLTLT